MAKLDRFFQAMFDRSAGELQLFSGRSPALVLPEGLQPASSVQPTVEQVLGLLAEVVDPDLLKGFESSGSLETSIQRPGLPAMSLRVTSAGSAVQAVFVPEGSGRPTAASPAGAEAAATGPTGSAGPSDPGPARTPRAQPQPQQHPAPAASPQPAAAAVDATPAQPRHQEPSASAASPRPAAATIEARSAPPATPVDPGLGSEERVAMSFSPAPRTPASPGGPAPIDALFRMMVEKGASDLHLSTDETPILRIDGEVVRIEGEPPRSAQEVWALLAPITPQHNVREFESTHDTDFAYEIPGLARFRSNIFLDRKGPGAVFRTIPSKILTAADLGLSPQILDLCRLTKGLVLVTGPTGSGKSTTLTAMVDHINKTRSDHIITIEDPIEFVHENIRCLVNQREVGTHTDSFKRALRAALREDPDIVLVGEMRDLETIAIAIETAETGHLVFGTLHTTTAVSTVDRIIDQFPPEQQAQVRTMLSESLKGVIAQTLCRKIGGGRIAALEVLIGIPSVANLIREGKTFQIPSIMQTGRKHGMVTLNDGLLELLKSKTITAEEAFIKAVDKTAMTASLKAAGADVSFLAAEKQPALS